jgi:type II secretory pathway pseudopilin PulG
MTTHYINLKRQAFTIVELLVAVGVTAILVTLMVTITINVLNAWNRSSGNLTAGNQARLVLDQISQDLQGAVIRRDNNAWMVATLQPNQGNGAGDSGIGAWTNLSKPTEVDEGNLEGSLILNPSSANTIENSNNRLDIANYRFGQAGVWLRFFTTPPDNSKPEDAEEDDPVPIENTSAPRAVSYQLIRRELQPGSPDTVYSLYRSEVRPAGGASSTFVQGYNLLGAAYVSASGDSTQGGVANVRSPHPTDIIANDVIDFGVKLYGRNPAGVEVELFPVARDPATSPTAGAVVPVFAVSNLTSGGGIVYGYPTAADVMVRILTPEGVRLIQALERGDLQGVDWWEIAIQNSQVYTRRIEIKSKGL